MMALWVLVAKECYCRPGEMTKLKCEDLTAPAGGAQAALQVWSLTTAPQDRQEVDKVGISDNTIVVDRPLWLGPEIGRLKINRNPKDPLFDLSDRLALQQWKQACQDIGVSADRYQLRHAGASADTLGRPRLPAEVAARGRWGSAASARRYAKGGAIQKVLARLPLVVRQYGQDMSNHLEDVLCGRQPVELPVLPQNFQVVSIAQ